MNARCGVLAFTIVTLNSIFALAYPGVGDKVTWSGNLKNPEGVTSEVQIIKEVVAFNNDTKVWTVKINTKVGSEASTETIETADLFTPAKYSELLTHCKQNGGTLETLETNPGKYKTCKITTTENGVVIEKWWGDIPFGIVSKATRAPTGIKPIDSPLRVAVQGL
jgi:hypothetical protein